VVHSATAGSECDQTRGRIDNQPKGRIPPHYGKPLICSWERQSHFACEMNVVQNIPTRSVGLESLIRTIHTSNCVDAKQK
jgi:hypothetical protein